MEEKVIISADELAKFKFKNSDRVKFAEVDSFNVVHNVQYAYWLEWARILYMDKIGQKISPTQIIKEFPVVMVHSEIDYFNPAFFGSYYEVLTRITFVKNSSLGFENLVQSKDGLIHAKAKAVVVHLNLKTQSPERIPDHIRKQIVDFEGNDVLILD